MKRIKHIIAVAVALVTATMPAMAADYSTYLTTGRGFTLVKNVNDIIGGDDYCYILVSAEKSDLIVGVGAYEEKPVWASEETKALRYKAVSSDPVYDLSNFFTIEKSGEYIGLRNMMYSSSFFQTHDNAGYMYVLTYTEPTFRDWCYLIPTYKFGYWKFENGKYPLSSNDPYSGYLGPWN